MQKNRRILVVDDHRAIHDDVRKLLMSGPGIGGEPARRGAVRRHRAEDRKLRDRLGATRAKKER